MPNQDNQLLNSLRQVVLDNLGNEQFGVEDLSGAIGMSRSNLHRKLKVLRGQSISQFIRQVRLEEAHQLLVQNASTASEVAYQVGFNSPSYFNKCFHEHYGYPPGEAYRHYQEKGGSERIAVSEEEPKQPTERRQKAVLPAQNTGKNWLLFTSLTILILIAGFLGGRQLRFWGGGPAIQSIAILPLTHMSGDEEQEYLAAGLHNDLVNTLGQLSGLRVISRTSMLRYRQVGLTMRQIAKELGVQALVEGTVAGAGDSVTIQLQLFRIFPQERQLWAKQYRQNLRYIHAQQSDVVRNIAKEIHVTITPQEERQLAYTPEVNPAAYKAYLRGMFHWEKLTKADLDQAMDYFELALDIDPEYSSAYAGIAYVWVGRLQQGLVSYQEGGAKMKIAELQAKSQQLNQDLAEIHYMTGTTSCWIGWDYKKAEKELKRAIELNPNLSAARAYLSHVLNILHKPDEAMEQIDRALELDPLNPLFQALYGMDMLYARRFDEAISTLSKTLEKAPTDPVALATLRTAYHMKDRYEEALDIWETSYAAKGDEAAVEALLKGKQAGGYHAALESVAQSFIARSDTAYVTPYQIGTLFTRAGKKDEAVEWLEKAYLAHDSNMPYIGVDPIFDILRDDPRFMDLLQKMGLPLTPHPLAK